MDHIRNKDNNKVKEKQTKNYNKTRRNYEIRTNMHTSKNITVNRELRLGPGGGKRALSLQWLREDVVPVVLVNQEVLT